MAEAPQRHEDPLGEWVAAKLNAVSSWVRKIRLYSLILLVLGVGSIVASGFGPGVWYLPKSLDSPGWWIVTAICFHGLATRSQHSD